MTPRQSTNIGDVKVEEFYWGGKFVVYVNNQLVSTGYEQTVHDVTNGRDPSYVSIESNW